METYRVLLFDIDNTLLDFTAGAMQSMEAIFLEAGLAYTPEMFGVFQTENDKLWARIERGELTIAGLRDVRWQTILACLGLEADGAAMEDAFRIRLHESAVPVAGARETLEHLHGKYRLCAASNGPYAQQVNRLRRAGMYDFFETLFISGQIGAEKPSTVFFDRCMEHLPGVRPEQCLMIGDSLTADIAGGRAAGMHTCWFDPDDRGSAMPPQADLRITRLEQLAAPLKAAGVDRLNISLDTLRPERYREITRTGELENVLRGIEAAERAGFENIKLNCVLLGGMNDDEIGDFVRLTAKKPWQVRFIELMPMGVCAAWPPERFLPAQEVLSRVPELRPAGRSGVAQLYRLPGAAGMVGLIEPMSCAFCADCTRIRITADGKLKPCLHSDAELALRGLSGAELEAAIRQGILMKPARHRMDETGVTETHRGMFAIGG